ncbi:MAG: hypothetical protein LAQ69_15790 [Acidobacteriia bacterium]|nr:hypothetical protein [Terriglobia bacterium]
MPKTKKPFTPDPNQLRRGIEHICNEYANLMSAAHWDMKGSAPWRTHADDAFLLGYRKLGDFLFNKNRLTVKNQECPDILALDYLPSSCTPNWTLPKLDSGMAGPDEQTTRSSLIHQGTGMGSLRLGSEAGKGVSDRLATVPARDRSQVQEALCYRDHKVSAQAGFRRN